MQSAEAVLDVLRERGRRGLPVNELYRQLFNPQLYLLAYGRIYSNKGAMTPGPDAETADGMTLGKIGRIIDALRHERYRFKPVRRHYIPKKDGKQRSLGLPSWSDKLLGEVVRLLLEAYYEPQFSDHSHGYRPSRGCHTALRDVAVGWTATTWFIEGDISRCFDELDHQVMLQTLGEKIDDNRFLRLIGQMLRAGYLEDWVWNATLSGAPQGGVLSPCLSNVYLHRLDRFVETVLMPGYTRGELRRSNPESSRVRSALHRARKRGDHAAARALRKQQRSLPTGDPCDPGYRRLRYVRYADLCGHPHKSAYAEFRVMPSHCSLGANLPAQRNIRPSRTRHNSFRPVLPTVRRPGGSSGGPRTDRCTRERRPHAEDVPWTRVRVRTLFGVARPWSHSVAKPRAPE